MRKPGSYVPVHVEFSQHPKTWNLADALDVPVVHVIGHLVALWTWAKSTLSADADLGRWRPGVIARGAQWTGDVCKFVDALVDTGWLDRDEDGALMLHEADIYSRKVPRKVATARDDSDDTPDADLSPAALRKRKQRDRERGVARDSVTVTADVTPMSRDVTLGHAHVTPMSHAARDQSQASHSTEKRDESAVKERGSQRDSHAVTPDVTHPPMRWPTEPKPRALNRGVLGLQEANDKPAAEAAIRACLTSEGKDERLTGLLRDLGPDAGDALESLMGAWSRKYDMDGPAPAVAGLRQWLREKAEKAKRDALNSEAAKARASKQGLVVADDGTVVGAGSTKESWDALCLDDWRKLTAAGEDEPAMYDEYKALYRSHYASGGASRWEERQRAQGDDAAPDFAGLVKGKPTGKQQPDEARTLARRDYDGLTGMGVKPGQRWVDYWQEHREHYERGGGSRWEAHLAQLEGAPAPQVLGPVSGMGGSEIVNLWSAQAQDGGAQ